MTTLQEQVDQLKDENRQKQMMIEQLLQQVRSMETGKIFYKKGGFFY